MPSPVRLDIDLQFSLSADDSRSTVVGSVSADGTDVTVTLRDGAVRLPDDRTALALARVVGAELARLGLTVSLKTRHGVVGTAGAVRPPRCFRSRPPSCVGCAVGRPPRTTCPGLGDPD